MLETFEVTIEREIDASLLSWPGRGEAAEEGLGCNRDYCDLRGFTWREVRQVLEQEGAALSRIQEMAKLPADDDDLMDDLWEFKGEYLSGLDLGVAAAVTALSAARCVPFSSCNGGCLGDRHHEEYPVIAFYAREPWIVHLLACAEEAGVGLGNSHSGSLVAYSGNVLDMLAFAKCLYTHRRSFRALRGLAPRSARVAACGSAQLPLAL